MPGFAQFNNGVENVSTGTIFGTTYSNPDSKHFNVMLTYFKMKMLMASTIIKTQNKLRIGVHKINSWIFRCRIRSYYTLCRLARNIFCAH